jgi:hypothetical protein
MSRRIDRAPYRIEPAERSIEAAHHRLDRAARFIDVTPRRLDAMWDRVEEQSWTSSLEPFRCIT